VDEHVAAADPGQEVCRLLGRERPAGDALPRRRLQLRAVELGQLRQRGEPERRRGLVDAARVQVELDPEGLDELFRRACTELQPYDVTEPARSSSDAPLSACTPA